MRRLIALAGDDVGGPTVEMSLEIRNDAVEITDRRCHALRDQVQKMYLDMFEETAPFVVVHVEEKA